MLPINTFVIIGPESTGKTTLCQQLASYYKGNWIEEYARTYIKRLKRPYNYLDVLHIAKKQKYIEENYKTNNPFLFIDTDLIITKVWFLHRYKVYPEWIDEYLKNAYRKAYLICYPDLPWEYDPVRENPHIRDYLFDWYVQEVIKLSFPYKIIHYQGHKRFNNAVEFIDTLI